MTPRRTAARATIACLAVAAALAGCGSSGGGPSSAGTGGGSPAGQSPTSSSTTPGPMPSGSMTSAAAPAGGASSAGAAPGAGKPAASAMVEIKDFAYRTPPTVAPGSTVSVRNADSEAHTLTADRGGAFAVVLPPRATKTFTAPAAPGRYTFHCEYHANMHGTLVVS